jgi:hypothetical protein
LEQEAVEEALRLAEIRLAAERADTKVLLVLILLVAVELHNLILHSYQQEIIQ